MFIRHAWDIVSLRSRQVAIKVLNAVKGAALHTMRRVSYTRFRKCTLNSPNTEVGT